MIAHFHNTSCRTNTDPTPSHAATSAHENCPEHTSQLMSKVPAMAAGVIHCRATHLKLHPLKTSMPLACPCTHAGWDTQHFAVATLASMPCPMSSSRAQYRAAGLPDRHPGHRRDMRRFSAAKMSRSPALQLRALPKMLLEHQLGHRRDTRRFSAARMASISCTVSSSLPSWLTTT